MFDWNDLKYLLAVAFAAAQVNRAQFPFPN